MGIVRLLIIGVVVWLAFKLLKRLSNSSSKTEGTIKEIPSKKMVECKNCGLHIPLDEAISEGDKYFCCDEHRAHHQENHTDQ